MSYNWINLAKADGATLILGRSGSTAIHDYSTGGHDAVITGTHAPGQSLADSYFLNSFNSSATEEATIAASADFDVTASWSIEFMGKPTTVTTDDTLIHYGPTFATNGFKITFQFGSPVLNSVLATTARADSMPSNQWVAGQQRHWIFVFDNVGSPTMAIYKDSVQEEFPTTVTVDSAVNAASLVIGDISTGGSDFDGPIGLIAIYKNTLLTSEQVKRHYNATIRPSTRFRSFRRIYRRR